jgi:hypothetical protein
LEVGGLSEINTSSQFILLEVNSDKTDLRHISQLSDLILTGIQALINTTVIELENTYVEEGERISVFFQKSQVFYLILRHVNVLEVG